MTPINTTDSIDTMDAKVLDHYVCTILPNGVRVQVGPMSEPGARYFAGHLKAKSASLSYATWVDWRRLHQWPLLDIEQFRTEVAPAASRAHPTLPLGHLSDRILIEELKSRGYVVPKKSHVCDLTCQQGYQVFEYEAMSRNEAWMDAARHSLAKRLGSRLLTGGALEFSTVEVEPGLTALRCRAVVVAPEPLNA